jgi:hypothetical protein
MKRRCLTSIVAFLGVGLLCCTNAFAFDVLAFGTSAINCHGVPRDQIFSARLQGNLRADGIDVTVINAGQDGDLPMWMPKRIQPLLTPNIRLVIFEPGPNAKTREQTLPYAEEVLALLQKRQIATIYVSVGSLQNNGDADMMAKKYGAVAYGHWARDIPLDARHFQFDQNQGGKGRGGHLTAEGCALWARNMTPLVESVIRQAGLK